MSNGTIPTDESVESVAESSYSFSYLKFAEFFVQDLRDRMDAGVEQAGDLLKAGADGFMDALEDGAKAVVGITEEEFSKLPAETKDTVFADVHKTLDDIGSNAFIEALAGDTVNTLEAITTLAERGAAIAAGKGISVGARHIAAADDFMKHRGLSKLRPTMNQVRHEADRMSDLGLVEGLAATEAVVEMSMDEALERLKQVIDNHKTLSGDFNNQISCSKTLNTNISLFYKRHEADRMSDEADGAPDIQHQRHDLRDKMDRMSDEADGAPDDSKPEEAVPVAPGGGAPLP